MTSLATLALIPRFESAGTAPWYIVVPWYAMVALLIILGVSVFICLIISIAYLWKYIRFLQRDYQKKPTGKLKDGAITVTMLPLKGMMIGPRFTFMTQNDTSFKFEYNQPVQAAHFIKPVDKVIRPDDIPVFVHCEPNFWRRLRNKIFCIPTPRIVVKQFTDKGIVWDEENTYGIDVILELTPKSPQI
ncbi:MAG: hypothetical protein EHM12_01605 [Dehalococcoidia bacterium]|nr:MAG: hypothetical protein EHM12_01605 [Dehalococcoidia bacterium]